MNKQVVNSYIILQINHNVFNLALHKALIMLIKKEMNIIVFKNVQKVMFHLQYFKYQ